MSTERGSYDRNLENQVYSPQLVRLVNLVDTPLHKPWLEDVTSNQKDFRLRFLASRNYQPEWLKEGTRKVFFDILGALVVPEAPKNKK